MNEGKRQAYLEAMGIQTYYPRRRLPGAKPSPLYEFPIQPAARSEIAEAARTEVLRKSQGEKSTGGLAAIEELRSRATAVRKATVVPIRPSEAASGEKGAASAAEADAQQSLSFALRYYPINANLAILDEVPTQASVQLRAETLALLQAILKALGQEGIDATREAEEFSWPVHSAYSMKNSPEVEAAKAISGFLQMRQETDGFTNLLVFAGQLEAVLLQNQSQLLVRDFESGKGYSITVTHSLASMLGLPTLKREVWQHLQPLRKRIDSAS